MNAHLEKGTFLFAFEIDSGVNTCLKRSNYLSNFARLQGTIQQKKNIIDKTMFCGNRESATLFIQEREEEYRAVFLSIVAENIYEM